MNACIDTRFKFLIKFRENRIEIASVVSDTPVLVKKRRVLEV